MRHGTWHSVASRSVGSRARGLFTRLFRVSWFLDRDNPILFHGASELAPRWRFGGALMDQWLLFVGSPRLDVVVVAESW